MTSRALAVITVDRPGARNAISLETMDALDAALDAVAAAAALVIRGGGDRAFVPGALAGRRRDHQEAVTA